VKINKKFSNLWIISLIIIGVFFVINSRCYAQFQSRNTEERYLKTPVLASKSVINYTKYSEIFDEMQRRYGLILSSSLLKALVSKIPRLIAQTAGYISISEKNQTVSIIHRIVSANKLLKLAYNMPAFYDSELLMKEMEDDNWNSAISILKWNFHYDCLSTYSDHLGRGLWSLANDKQNITSHNFPEFQIEITGNIMRSNQEIERKIGSLIDEFLEEFSESSLMESFIFKDELKGLLFDWLLLFYGIDIYELEKPQVIIIKNLDAIRKFTLSGNIPERYNKIIIKQNLKTIKIIEKSL
jgi:hypothetical protein